VLLAPCYLVTSDVAGTTYHHSPSVSRNALDISFHFWWTKTGIRNYGKMDKSSDGILSKFHTTIPFPRRPPGNGNASYGYGILAITNYCAIPDLT